MGTWGTGILEDDTALDIHGDFIERFDDGESPDAARQAAIRRYYDQFLDEETNAAVWLGLAQAEWDVGALQPDTLQAIEQIVATGQDLARWDGPNQDQRQAVLQAFVETLRTPRETPRVPTPIVAKPAVAQPGTCFAVKLLDGQGWGAGVVLALTGNKYDTYHLLAGLRGVYPAPRPLSVYERRDWLTLTHHNFKGDLCLTDAGAEGFAKDRDTYGIVMVGQMALRADEPVPPLGIMGWEAIGVSSWGWIECQVRLQHRWDTEGH